MKTKTILSLIGAILLVACVGNASPVACQSFASFTTLLGYGSTGCEVGDLIFSNFADSGSPPSNSNLTGNITVTNGQNTGYAVNFSSQAGDLTTSFVVSYTVTIDTTVSPGTQAGEDITSIGAGLQADGSGSSSLVKTTPFGPITVTAAGGVTTSNPISANGVATTVNITDTFTQGTGGTLNFSNTYTESNTSGPEPSTMLLMGGALLGLGAIGRRRIRKS